MIRKLLLAALMISAAGLSYAESLKIGVVDVERLLRESQPAMQAEKKIEQTFSVRNKEIKRLAAQVKDMESLLDREGGAMAVEEFRAKERELNAMRLNLQRLQREFREDLNLRKNEELVVVMDKANKAIQKIASSGKFDLILQDVVYRNPSIDITDKVIELLSQRGR